jgi:hypothetical protein
MEIVLTENEKEIVNMQSYKINIPIDRLYLLYYLRYKKQIPPSEMVQYISKSKRTIQYYLKQLGWEYDIFEAQQMSAKKKDYSGMFKAMRKTWVKNNYASNAENMARELINIKLNEEIQADIIVGIHNMDIISPYEIDIPVIIIYNGFTYKYAIEYNGDLWHKNRQCQDGIKAAMMINAGYKPLIITEYGSTKTQKEHGSIEQG